MRVLVAVAQPVDTAKLGLEQEESFVRRSFQSLVDAELIEIDVLRTATPTQLGWWVSGSRYDIVHFMGRERFDGRQVFLVFQDDEGVVSEIDVPTLCEILRQPGIQLFIPNVIAHDEASGSVKRKADFWMALGANGLPVVVADQFTCRDESATEFFQSLYRSLAQGTTFERAARIAAASSKSHDTID